MKESATLAFFTLYAAREFRGKVYRIPVPVKNYSELSIIDGFGKRNKFRF